MAVRTRITSILASVVLAVSVLVAQTDATPGDVITLDDSFNSVAGIATDTERGVYWIAPDASQGEFVAVSPDGTEVGRVTLDADISPIFALSMSSGFLYAATADQSESGTDTVDVYRLESIDYGSSATYSHWTVTLPDGPQRIKAFTVSTLGNFYLISFASPGGLYLVEEAIHHDGELTAARVADAPDWVTDMAFTSDVDAAVRSYTTVTMMNLADNSVWASASLPEQPCGEAITPDLTGSALVISSLGSNELIEVEIPSTIDDALPAASSQPPSGSTTSAQSSSGSSTSSTDSGWGISRTTIAIGSAAGLSLIAGVLAFCVPGRATRVTTRRRRRPPQQ